MRLLLFTAVAWAQEHGAEGAHEHLGPVTIPWSTIGVQAFNFVLLIGILFFLLRKTVQAHFAQRAATYRELVDRAENARREAEQSHNQAKERLSKLEESAKQAATSARQEAEDLRARMLIEAKALAQKMEQEAQRTTALELEKAKAELRRDLLSQALNSSEQTLKKGLGSVEQKKLQNEFAEKIEVVGG